MAGKNGYRIAFSNPCFESWYLFHYTDNTGYLEDCDAVIKQLQKKGRLPGYAKPDDFYQTLLPLQQEAVRRAEKRMHAVLKECDHKPRHLCT